jgi:hypothetical protein
MPLAIHDQNGNMIGRRRLTLALGQFSVQRASTKRPRRSTEARTGQLLGASGRRYFVRKQSPSRMALELVILSTNVLLFWMGAWT